MKKLIWITYDWMSDFGGKGIDSAHIITHLAKSDFSVSVLNFELHTSSPQLDRRTVLGENVPLHSISVSGIINLLYRCFCFFKKHAYDGVILSASPSIDLAILILLYISRLCLHTPIIRIEYTNIFKFFSASQFSAIYFHLAKRYFPKLKLTIVNNQEALTRMQEEFCIHSRNIITIHSPVIDAEKFPLYMREPVSEAVFDAKREYKIVISSMRLSRADKDFDTLFTAFDFVRKNVSAVLVLLGSGDPRIISPLLEKYNLILQKDVFLFGFKDNPIKYIAQSDVFSFASRYEGNPRVITEALACGIPVVATDCDFGPRESIRDGLNGFLIPVGDGMLMGEKLLAVLSCPRTLPSPSSVQKDIVESFSIEKSVRAYEQAIKRVYIT
ncbi:MAG: glycosyltransferase [Candidatus Paceibacterota bacterium]